MVANHYHNRKFRSTPTSPTPTSSTTNNWKNAICHKCGGKGHIARVCPSQRDEEPDQANFAYDAVDDEAANDFAF
jgi:hypothetical protein